MLNPRRAALLCLVSLARSDAFTLGGVSRSALGLRAAPGQRRCGSVDMGLFDGLKAAFANEPFKEDDQRVRASHILVKGDDDVERIVALLGEIGQRVGDEPSRLGPVFAEVARRESACASAAQGGDLGMFGPGKMVPEFDAACFPAEAEAPGPGSLLGPIVTDFGCHAILVTKREVNRDQVEEKLARND